MLEFRSAAARGVLAILCCSVLLLPSLMFSQAATALSFEVASIKPSQEITPALGKAVIASGKLHIGMSVDAARVEIGFMSLADLIPIAFAVKPYQVSGPEWMKVQRFDILAKMPDGATKEQVPKGHTRAHPTRARKPERRNHPRTGKPDLRRSGERAATP